MPMPSSCSNLVPLSADNLGGAPSRSLTRPDVTKSIDDSIASVGLTLMLTFVTMHSASYQTAFFAALGSSPPGVDEEPPKEVSTLHQANAKLRQVDRQFGTAAHGRVTQRIGGSQKQSSRPWPVINPASYCLRNWSVSVVVSTAWRSVVNSNP